MVAEDTQIEINEIETAPAIPKGIDDFDASCLDDPNNAAAYAYEIFKYYKKESKSFKLRSICTSSLKSLHP
ncbi:hypothetical protein CEXT_51741 [Caerostris extrusa]|uniref:Uncharacterized protein n=1 Tax=Caerostris extrusa TaxID=172846 RepID=A0AAV4QF17_CAEEX|nr:hypothetical protein CEXT_51741 [Caerostris extrusa]